MQSRQDTLPAIERSTLAALAALSLAMRAVAYFHYRFDSDEPQHLHVAWGWTAGLVQYRDYFDNHAPLFHMATAPILALLGERPDILLWMRAPMLLLWAAVLACTWALGRRFWDGRVAAYAVVLLSLFPPFFLKSIEYRTDNAWNTVCVAALTLFLVGRRRPGDAPSTARLFATGFLLGVALCISMKTPLVVVSMLLASVATAYASKLRFRIGRTAAETAAFAGGFAIVPAIVIAFFASRAALPALAYCVVRFNELVALTHKRNPIFPFLYPLELFFLLFYVRRIAPPPNPDEEPRGRLFLGAFLAVYVFTLTSFWVLISPRDLLPAMPVAALFVAALIRDRIAMPRWRAAVLVAIAIACTAALTHYTARFSDRTEEHISMMRQALRLTRPGEPLMDLKGETVYRRRPFYFIFELITREAIEKGLIADTVEASVIGARCHVAQADGPFFPKHARAFLRANFLDLGRLRASGQWVAPDGSFSIAVPGEYAIVTASGSAAGNLDGTPYSGPRELAAGPHRFEASTQDRLACIWAPAVARGFSPFHGQMD